MKFKKAVVLIMVLLCSPLEETLCYSETSVPRYGGTLHLGFYTKPTQINPVLTTQGISMLVMNLVFSRLIRSNEKGEIEKDLAESWSLSEDEKVYTFFLKKNIRFHDGVELTAEDAQFTYQSILDPKNSSPYAAYYSLVDKLEVVDKYTFRITLKEPQPSFLSELEREIMPKHLYSEEGSIMHSPHNYAPIGSGPFRFKEWRADDSIVLAANTAYADHRPYLDEIIITPYPDAEALWDDFMKQKIDVNLFLSPKNYLWTAKDPAFKTFFHPITFCYNIAYNFESKVSSNLVARQAIAYGVNKKEIIEKIEKGFGEEANGPFLKSSWAYDPNIPLFVYDPEKSRALLQQAGWSEDKKGMFVKDGQPLEFKLLVDARNEKDQKIAMVLRQQLSQIGVLLKVMLYDNNASFEELEKNADAWLYFNIGGLDPNQMVKTYHSKQTTKDKKWVLNSFTAKVDSLIELGRMTTDQEKRREIYHALHDLVYADQLRLCLYFPYTFHAARKNLHNINLFLNENMPTYLLKEVYLEDN